MQMRHCLNEKQLVLTSTISRYLSQVHQVGDLLFETGPVLTVVLQDEILSDKQTKLNIKKYSRSLVNGAFKSCDCPVTGRLFSHLVTGAVPSTPGERRRSESEEEEEHTLSLRPRWSCSRQVCWDRRRAYETWPLTSLFH